MRTVLSASAKGDPLTSAFLVPSDFVDNRSRRGERETIVRTVLSESRKVCGRSPGRF